MERNLALEFVRVTEAAALSSARLMGRGDEKAADQAAVDAMRRAFDVLEFRGEIVIGEGERDQAPMLFIGEKVGRGDANSPQMDIACDPLEGTTLCATGQPNSISVIAIGERGGLMRAPDTYMEKIAVGPECRGRVSLDKPVIENLRAVAAAKNVYLDDLTVVILDRPRHAELIREVRATGARVKLIGDGDVSAAIAACIPDSGVDMLIGSGGAPEGVIAAAALKCMGGDFQGRFKYRNEEERARAQVMGIALADLDKIWALEELARGDVMFSATGITTGEFLRGVRFTSSGAITHSVVMRSKTGTVRYLDSHHHFSKKPNHGW